MKYLALISFLIFSTVASAGVPPEVCAEMWSDSETEFTKAEMYVKSSIEKMQNSPNITDKWLLCKNVKDAMSDMLDASHYFQVSADNYGEVFEKCVEHSDIDLAWKNFEISLDNKYTALKIHKQMADVYYQSYCVVYNL